MDDDTIIGFVFYGMWEEKNAPLFCRYMIDIEYQGKGYGKRALPIIVDEMMREYQTDCIYLTLEAKNERAVHLYTQFEYIENDINCFLTAEKLIERASWMNFYVVCDDNKIIGCGAIGPYWGKEDESSLFTIFVLPDYQRKGIGRKIIQTLEQDEFFLRAKRIEIPASITAIPFYLKMGYTYKNGITEPDEEQLVRLEKFR